MSRFVKKAIKQGTVRYNIRDATQSISLTGSLQRSADLGGIDGIIRTSNVLVGTDTNVNINDQVLVFVGDTRLADSGPRDDRLIEFEQVFQGQSVVDFDIVTGANSSYTYLGVSRTNYEGIQVDGHPIDLERPNGTGEELRLERQYVGETEWAFAGSVNAGNMGQIMGQPYATSQLTVTNVTGDRPYRLRLRQNEYTSIDGGLRDSFAIKNIRITGKLLGAHVSGISSLPPRVQLDLRDRTGGHYPNNSRTGDSDGGKLDSFPFDDRKTFLFTSPFPEAEVLFVDPIDTEEEIFQFIDVTGSHENVRFRISLSDTFPVLDENILRLPLLRAREDGTIKLASQLDLSNEFIHLINNRTGSLGLKAYYKKESIEKLDESGKRRDTALVRHKVLLRYNKPESSVSKPSINVGVIEGAPPEAENPIRIKQFTRTSMSKIDPSQRIERSRRPTEGLTPGSHRSPTLFGSFPKVPGITDNNYIPESENKITPFDESRVNLTIGTSFESTGTAPTILEGFESPLRSKTQIVLDFQSSNGSGTPIFFATGSAATSKGPIGTFVPSIAGVSGSGMAYWSNTKRRWELLQIPKDSDGNIPVSDPLAATRSARAISLCGFGLKLSGSTLGNINDAIFTDAGSPPHFSSNGKTQHNLKVARAFKGVGTPVESHGFPFGEQYNATGSQELRMSQYISSPFLLEKMTVEIDGIFGVGTSLNTSLGDIRTKNFFLLNQSTNGDNPHVGGQEIVNAFQGGLIRNSVKTSGIREIVSWAKIGFIPERSTLTSSLAAFKELRKDYEFLGIHKDEDYIANKPFFSGTIFFNLEPKLPLASEDPIALVPARGTNDKHHRQFFQMNKRGGADGLGNASGRQLASSLGRVDEIVTGSLFEKDSDFGGMAPKESHYVVSPYLLMPEDRLIFGWQNIDYMYDYLRPTSLRKLQEEDAADQMVDQIKRMKVTLYGSLVKDGKEFHDTLNQNLTTKSVHESIFGLPVVDQYDVEPIQNLSGSTQDALFFGSIKSFLQGAADQGVRGRRASIAAGQGGATGSLSRNIGFFNSDVKLTDSLTPPIEFLISDPQFFAPTGSAHTSSHGNGSGINLNLNIGNTARKVLALSANPASSSIKLLKTIGLFNRRNFVARRTFSPASNFLQTPGGGLVTNANFLAIDNTVSGPSSYKIFSGSIQDVKGVKSFGSPEISLAKKVGPPKLLSEPRIKLDISKLFFAAPLIQFGKVGFPVLKLPNFGCVPLIRGFKIGFSNVTPTSPKNYFRRDSYGQFRDMIEQAPETATEGLSAQVGLDINKNGYGPAQILEGWPNNDGPVKIKFFSRSVVREGLFQERTPNIDPSDTNTQNLSTFATCSLPYIDGQTTERDVVNNPPPDLTDVTTIEEAVQQIIDGDA